MAECSTCSWIATKRASPGINCLSLVLTQNGNHVESHIWFWEPGQYSKLGDLVTESARSDVFHMDLTAAARVCAAILSMVS